EMLDLPAEHNIRAIIETINMPNIDEAYERLKKGWCSLSGSKLDSKAIIADGNCTMVCVYMSAVLLISSLLHHWTRLAYLDVLGSLGLCWFCYSEGKKALESASHIEKD